MSLVRQIALSLQLPEKYVRGVAATASYRYKVFTIKKSDGKSDRTIEQPSKEVKLLQRWLVRRLFDPLPTHPSAHAYVKGKSILTNASLHRKSRYLSRLDLKDFFPSLRRSDVESLLKSSHAKVGGRRLTEKDIQIVCSLVCRFERLTIGAPSSPTICNKLMYNLDGRLSKIAAEHGAIFTRYADDLYFSSTQRLVLYTVCREAENAISTSASPRLTINKLKTFHASHKRRMAVTGLILTTERKVSLGRDLKRKIRVVAHRASIGKIKNEELSWLRGMIAFAASIEPRYADGIRSKYHLVDLTPNSL